MWNEYSYRMGYMGNPSKGHFIWGLWNDWGRLADKFVCSEYRKQFLKPIVPIRIGRSWRPKQVDLKRRMMPSNKLWKIDRGEHADRN